MRLFFLITSLQLRSITSRFLLDLMLFNISIYYCIHFHEPLLGSSRKLLLSSFSYLIHSESCLTSHGLISYEQGISVSKIIIMQLSKATMLLQFTLGYINVADNWKSQVAADALSMKIHWKDW